MKIKGFTFKCTCEWSKNGIKGFIPNTTCEVHGKKTRSMLRKTVPFKEGEK